MLIDHCSLDRDVEDEFARRRAPRCYTRPATADAAPPRTGAEDVALAFAFAAISCAAFLILLQ
jgi:hypothetical protein